MERFKYLIWLFFIPFSDDIIAFIILLIHDHYRNILSMLDILYIVTAFFRCQEKDNLNFWRMLQKTPRRIHRKLKNMILLAKNNYFIMKIQNL